MPQNQAVVVLSGGQDSTTCLYWAISKFGRDRILSLTFDYGQRHRVELECAKKVAELAEVPNTLLTIDTFRQLGGTALTDDEISVRSEVDSTTNLPNTFVPGRNLIFLTYAAAFAYKHDAVHLVTGVAQTDYSGLWVPNIRVTRFYCKFPAAKRASVNDSHHSILAFIRRLLGSISPLSAA